MPEPSAVQKGNSSSAVLGMFGSISAQETQKGEMGVGIFFFFCLGEGRGGRWLVVLFFFLSKSPDLQQHFLGLFLEFRQDRNITQSYT